jgi:thiol-disulfide isomerase/thioredoxin
MPMASPEARRALLLGGAGVAAAVAGGGLAWWRLKPRGGEALPEGFWVRSFPTPQDAKLEMATLKGKPLVVNFWATWCPPCVEEMPLLDRFYREHAAKGWQVIGLAVDQAPAVRQFLTRTPVSFPIGLAGLEGTSLGRELGNQTGGLPYTVLIGAAGNVLRRKIGQISAAELGQWRSMAAD